MNFNMAPDDSPRLTASQTCGAKNPWFLSHPSGSFASRRRHPRHSKILLRIENSTEPLDSDQTLNSLLVG